MTDLKNDNTAKEDLLASLLSHAPLRPSPDAAAQARAYAELHALWSKQVARRRRRRYAALLSLAATIVAAVGLVALQPSTPAARIPVAQLAHTSGTAALLLPAGDGDGEPMTSDTTVVSGDVVRTGAETRIALSWHGGGSLRLAERTTVEFTSSTAARLVAGRVYFDSHAPVHAAVTPVEIAIQTRAGAVAPVGTQFMIEQDGGDITVTVREGRIELHRQANTYVVGSGFQITANRGGVTDRREAERTGPRWEWVTEASPGFAGDKANAYDFLVWVARETGRTLTFSERSERAARAAPLIGFGTLAPTFATLKAVAEATDMNVDVDTDKIRVSERVRH